MKYKLIGIISCTIVLAASIINYSDILSYDDKRRYIEHVEAEQKQPCSLTHNYGEICTHLPLISIHTDGKEIPGKGVTDSAGRFVGFSTDADGSDRITAHMNLTDNEERNNHISDEPNVSSDIIIHARGNSSRYFDKLGYRVELIDKNGEKNPQSLLGMDAHHEWVLHGPYLDKTLIRNYMWYNIAGECMEYAPNVRFCELVLNGEYQGVYLLCELISKGDGEGRLNLSLDSKDNTYSGYLLRLDRNDGNWNARLNNFSSYTYRKSADLKLEIQYPKEKDLTPDIIRSINDDFSNFEKSLYSYDYNNKKYGYENYIDVDSFVDYFIINEFTMNYDAGRYSTYLYKDISGKIKMCVWDFNNSCDNYQEQSLTETHDFEIQNRLWFKMLTRDRKFIEKVISRYRELRKGPLSEEYLMKFIDDTVSYLGPAIGRNYEKWGYSFGDDTLLRPAQRNLHSYDEAVAQLKNFIKERGKWMDDNIESLRQYSAESKVKKFNEVTE